MMKLMAMVFAALSAAVGLADGARPDISGETARQTAIAEGGRADWRVAPEEAKAVAGWMIETAQRPVDSNEVAVANPPRDMKLFLLIGQSNMAGRGTVSAEDRKAPPRCLKLNRDGIWVEATSPIHFDRRTAGYGIADTFVRRYLEEHPNDTVGLIPCAVGGSMSATWSPEDGASDPIGSNYRFALNRARLAQRNGQIVGILWHQGEADRKFVSATTGRNRYVSRLAALAAALRDELGCPDAPFLIGEIGTLPVDCTAMNPVLAAAADVIPNCKLVKASDLSGHLPDGVHFDTPSYKILGARYYEAWKTVALAGEADAAALPPLVGDGVADDTAAIQARLDSGASCVYLPPPKDHYVISKTLKIGANQELKLDRFTRIRLAPKSDCPMLENRCYRAGAGTNAFVAVTGGVWDMDNRNQRPNFMQVQKLAAAAPKKHDPDFFFGMAIRFCHVEHLTVRGVTIRNPSNYGIEFGHVSYVTADDVTFDYREGNPFRLNMDGLHFDGHCHHLRITNVRGSCFDDMVALNANDGMCSPEEGPISDVTIDGLYCGYCHSGVRLLSADAPVSRVTIRNVHGNFYISAVWLTHNFGDRPAPGRFDDIVISDIFAGKALPPPEVDCAWRRALGLIHLEGNSSIGNLVLERIYRDEKTLPSGTLVCDSSATTVENLTVRDCRMTNRLKVPIKFLDVKGRVQKLVNENNTFVGAWEDK